LWIATFLFLSNLHAFYYFLLPYFDCWVFRYETENVLSGEKRHPCLISDFRGKVSLFYHKYISYSWDFFPQS
jgi:hypothetical protein